MNSASLACVIDANVALKLFFVQPLSDQADILFKHLEVDTQARFHVPDFFYAECVSAFANYVRLARYPAATAKQDVAELCALALRITSSIDLAADATDIAIRHQVSGYDAFYVALAVRINVPLVTADEKLVKAVGNRYDVQSLAAFPIPPLP